MLEDDLNLQRSVRIHHSIENIPTFSYSYSIDVIIGSSAVQITLDFFLTTKKGHTLISSVPDVLS